MLKKGTKVTWKWGRGKAEGKVIEVYTDTITKEIKDTKIKRKGSKENPAYYIEQKNGNHILKLESQLEK